MFKPSCAYAVTDNGIVVFKGNKKQAKQYRVVMSRNYPIGYSPFKLWFSPTANIGQTLK